MIVISGSRDLSKDNNIDVAKKKTGRRWRPSSSSEHVSDMDLSALVPAIRVQTELKGAETGSGQASPAAFI